MSSGTHGPRWREVPLSTVPWSQPATGRVLVGPPIHPLEGMLPSVLHQTASRTSLIFESVYLFSLDLCHQI